MTPRQVTHDEGHAANSEESTSLIVQHIDGLGADEFHERLDGFFSGEAPIVDAGDLSLGPSDADIRKRDEAVIDDLEAYLMTGSSVTAPKPQSKGVVWDASDLAEVEKVYDEPPKPTPYDRALTTLRAAESAVRGLSQGSAEYHEAMGRLAVTRRNLRTEMERSTDDSWREIRKTDEWRAGNGRDEYNQARRNVRTKPNTDKATMAAMSLEERKIHTNAQKADSAWVKRKRAAGWSEEKIKTGLAAVQAKRKEKIQVAFVDSYKGNPSFGTF